MAYIKKKSERKFKITVCNGYKVNGQKRMKAQTITVPSSVPKRGIQQYVMAEAERIEKKFKYGVEESDQTHFEQYAENWLKRQEPFFKATTYAGYKRNLDIVYPLIGGIPLAKLLPMTLEEMCEELRKRPRRGGKCIKETTVQKYLETVSSVLEDAKKNDIIPFNPAHRVRKKHFEKEMQQMCIRDSLCSSQSQRGSIWRMDIRLSRITPVFATQSKTGGRNLIPLTCLRCV